MTLREVIAYGALQQNAYPGIKPLQPPPDPPPGVEDPISTTVGRLPIVVQLAQDRMKRIKELEAEVNRLNELISFYQTQFRAWGY